jgi:hypothetical protein
MYGLQMEYNIFSSYLFCICLLKFIIKKLDIYKYLL